MTRDATSDAIQDASPLLTDLYQLNMMQAYLDRGETKTAVFEFFVRSLPARRRFLIAGGLEQALEFLETLRFSADELDWLESTGRFGPQLIEYLASLRFTGDVHAIAEGTICFPNEPLLRVTAPLPLAQLIESRLRFSPYIKDAWVFAGPERAYASAVIVIDYDSVARWAGQKRMAFTNFTELAQTQEVYELVKQDVDRVNRTLPVGSRLRKYVNLHKEFDPDEGELTRTRKLRRAILLERYQEVIDAIYRNGKDVRIEARVAHRDGRMETVTTTLRIQSVEGAGG